MRTCILLVVAILVFSCKKDKKDDLQITQVTMTPGEGPVNLDLDRDGSADIKVYVDHPRMQAGYRNSCIIACINQDVELLTNEEMDTLFINKAFGNVPPNYFVIYNYVYHRVSSSDSIVKIEPAYKLIFSDTWQKSGNSATFKNGNFILQDQTYFISLGSVVINDTTRMNGLYVTENYIPFPDGQTKYLGFRFNSREGYVKLSISKYNIQVFETGISK